MFNVIILGTYLYLTPVVNKGGEYGTVGLKVTQKITDNVYLKFRTYSTPTKTEVNNSVKLYIDIDF